MRVGQRKSCDLIKTYLLHTRATSVSDIEGHEKSITFSILILLVSLQWTREILHGNPPGVRLPRAFVTTPFVIFSNLMSQDFHPLLLRCVQWLCSLGEWHYPAKDDCSHFWNSLFKTHLLEWDAENTEQRPISPPSFALMFSRDFTSHWIGTQYHPFQQGLAIPHLPIPMPLLTILHFSLTLEDPAVSSLRILYDLWPECPFFTLTSFGAACHPLAPLSRSHYVISYRDQNTLSVIKSMGRWRASSQPNSGLLTSFPLWFRLSVRHWILLSGLPCLWLLGVYCMILFLGRH